LCNSGTEQKAISVCHRWNLETEIHHRVERDKKSRRNTHAREDCIAPAKSQTAHANRHEIKNRGKKA
jgi:hypothetical protein